ncbi:H4MPT-linked C1 transfer pathway protein [Trinickia caryophylli]|nr:H4MPT-linked C1 transfer pathway protein [Trinickia caryophylli]TRX20218.1 H4MPT-linked C1 transfer pathway protein [Trinickia caryophylli]
MGTSSGPLTFGWDVGGAHLKVCVADAAGCVLDVGQWACPLWEGLHHLRSAIDLVFARWPAALSDDAHHAVTMTGEMVDLFPSREEGVCMLADALAERLGRRLSFFAGAQGWVEAGQCAERWRSVASANWLATASWVAAHRGDAVLVDIGSTTTDIVPIAGARVCARGADDAGRLATGELVYQGVVRTPLCALASRIEFGGVQVNVMNEWFATTADVYRLTGELDAACDLHPSADRGPKTEAASRVRLARMIGRDANEATADDWHRFAMAWRARQLEEVAENLARVEAAVGRSGRSGGWARSGGPPLVGAGCGRFLVAGLARDLGREYIDFADLVKAPNACGDWASTCAPSVAVALIAGQRRVSIGRAA